MGENPYKNFTRGYSKNSPLSPHIDPHNSQLQSAALVNHLMATNAMKDAFTVLQMPIVEMGEFVQQKIAENPLFEVYSESDILQEEDHEEYEARSEYPHFNHQSAKEYVDVESWLSYEPSWFERLFVQLKELFPGAREYSQAEKIIGNLNEKGYLDVPTEELAAVNFSSTEETQVIINKIKDYYEGDIGCRNIQEVLLYQLEKQGKKDSLAYQIINNCYQDFIHKRFKDIAKSLHQSQRSICEAIDKEITCLKLVNSKIFNQSYTPQSVIPDIILSLVDGEFHITVNEETLPQIKINQEYLALLHDRSLQKESKAYIKERAFQGQWLLKTLAERRNTLYRIAEQLLRIQSDFFIFSEGRLKPLTIKEISDNLELNESTVCRAISNKYLACDRGIFSLKSFFTSSIHTKEGENVSSNTIKELIKDVIHRENPEKPLSDEEISQALEDQGYLCARRTVSKYRQELNILSKRERKKT